MCDTVVDTAGGGSIPGSNRGICQADDLVGFHCEMCCGAAAVEREARTLCGGDGPKPRTTIARRGACELTMPRAMPRAKKGRGKPTSCWNGPRSYPKTHFSAFLALSNSPSHNTVKPASGDPLLGGGGRWYWRIPKTPAPPDSLQLFRPAGSQIEPPEPGPGLRTSTRAGGACECHRPCASHTQHLCTPRPSYICM